MVFRKELNGRTWEKNGNCYYLTLILNFYEIVLKKIKNQKPSSFLKNKAPVKALWNIKQSNLVNPDYRE